MNKKIEQIEKYRENPSFNFTAIKDYIFSPSYYYKKYVEKSLVNKTTASMNLGSLCHTLLLTPELFDDLYYIEEKSTPSIELLIETSYQLIKKNDLDMSQIDNDYICNLIEELNLFQNIKKKDTLIKTLEKINFFTLLENKYYNEDKSKVDPETFTKALNIKDSIVQNKFLNYFNCKQHSSSDFIEEFCEHPIYVSLEIPIGKNMHNLVYVKVLIDKLIVNHKTAMVTAYDLKFISSSPRLFLKDVAFKYRYDLQCALYSDAIKKYIAKEHPGYSFEGFKFIVCNVDYPDDAIIFNHTSAFEDIGRKGANVGNVILTGYQEAIASILWAKSKNHWVYNKTLYENKAQLDLVC